NTEVTPGLGAEMKPDVVVVATGGVPLNPATPGVNGKKVVTAHDVLAGKVAIHHGNVLIVGGGMVGCEVADMLANLGDNQITGGTHVTIVEMLHDIGLDVLPQPRMLLMARLREKGVRVIASATVKEILDDGVVVTKDGQEEAVHGMNWIILAMGTKSVDQLSNKIRDRIDEVYVIGDAKEPRRALEAIAEGAEVGRRV
ncbi:NADH:flavin oxidoreductase, partial [candidate division TA06 bacterium]